MDFHEEDFLESGLETRESNALKLADFLTKEQVMHAVESGVIRKTNTGTTVRNLGHKGFDNVIAWLSLTKEYRTRLKKINRIESSIRFLHKHGYKVEKNTY